MGFQTKVAMESKVYDACVYSLSGLCTASVTWLPIRWRHYATGPLNGSGMQLHDWPFLWKVTISWNDEFLKYAVLSKIYIALCSLRSYFLNMSSDYLFLTRNGFVICNSNTIKLTKRCAGQCQSMIRQFTCNKLIIIGTRLIWLFLKQIN